MRVVAPETADCELLRAGKGTGLQRLDALEYLPITTDAMREAARL